MLMDLFYDTLPPNITRKRRVHFHAFMIEMHKALHKQAERGIPVEDAISPVATELAKNVEVLCFDEFQVRRLVVLPNILWSESLLIHFPLTQ